MAKNKLEILAPAQAEFEEIVQVYLELAGVESAQNLIDRIYKALEYLKSHPNMGVSIKELRNEGYRALICDNYICIYRQIGDTVFVYHIVDGRSNYPQLFKELSNS